MPHCGPYIDVVGLYSLLPTCTLVPTLRTPWSWQKYCLNHCVRTCCSLRIVTRCRFTNWGIRCERGSRNLHFLSINLISFRRSRGIVLVMASRRGRWTARVDSEIQRNMCEMWGISALKGYQMEALEAVCVNKRDMLACVPTGSRNSCVFWSRSNPHLDRPRHCQRARSLVQRLWLARFV